MDFRFLQYLCLFWMGCVPDAQLGANTRKKLSVTNDFHGEMYLCSCGLPTKCVNEVLKSNRNLYHPIHEKSSLKVSGGLVSGRPCSLVWCLAGAIGRSVVWQGCSLAGDSPF